MRSKTLCLFLCLTLCLLELPICNANPYSDSKRYCDELLTGERFDCKDRALPIIAEWTSQTAFNAQKEVPYTGSMEVDMHRALYIESKTSIDVNFDVEMKDQCKIVLQVNENNVKIIDTTKNQLQVHKSIIFVFEPQCRLYVTLPTGTVVPNRLAHVFTSGIRTMTMPNEVLDRTKAENLKRGLGSFILSEKPREDIRDDLINTEDLVNNAFFIVPPKDVEKECFEKCKNGKLFVYKLKAGTEFANTFKLKPTCEWMSVFLNSTSNEATEISLRHGFVTLDGEMKAYPMDFESKDKKYYEVHFVYFLREAGQKMIKDPSGNFKPVTNWKSTIIVANTHGRAARTRAARFSTDEIRFAFSHDDCLADVIGSSLDAAYQDKMKNYEFNSHLNLAHLVAKKGYRSFRYGDKDPDENTYSKPASNLFGSEEPRDVDSLEVIKIGVNGGVTTVGPPAAASMTVPIEVDPPIHETHEEISYNQDKGDRDAEKQRVKQAGVDQSAYMYWAIPAGFGAGSFLSFIIANIILAVFRRSVLTFWYKSMYKRYGSDTTMGAGTTMGKTGAGETVGGSTTVGGGTTMGGTTAGETVGSTTAA